MEVVSHWLVAGQIIGFWGERWIAKLFLEKSMGATYGS